MEEKITNEQVIYMLFIVQRFQTELLEKGVQMSINAYTNDNGTWFAYCAGVPDKYINGYCYNFRTFDENREEFSAFKEKVKIVYLNDLFL